MIPCLKLQFPSSYVNGCRISYDNAVLFGDGLSVRLDKFKLH